MQSGVTVNTQIQIIFKRTACSIIAMCIFLTNSFWNPPLHLPKTIYVYDFTLYDLSIQSPCQFLLSLILQQPYTQYQSFPYQLLFYFCLEAIDQYKALTLETPYCSQRKLQQSLTAYFSIHYTTQILITVQDGNLGLCVPQCCQGNNNTSE